MGILVAGGVYVNQGQIIDGGHTLSNILAKFSEDTIYLHSNFSTTEEGITKRLYDKQRNDGVTLKTHNVDLAYGRITNDNFSAGSNILETFYTKDTYLKDIDYIILTTDINERDFRVIKNLALNKKIPFLVFSMSEFSTKGVRDGNLYILSERGLPTYNDYKSEILSVVQGRGIVGRKEITNREIPPSKIKKSGRVLLYLICLGLLVFLLAFGGFKILDNLNQTTSDQSASVDWGKKVDHEACNTIEDCKEVGDKYLKELEQYVDFGDEKHIFFENRTRTTYTDYEIVDGAKTDKESYQALPYESQQFEDLWDVFYTVFPENYIEDINTYRLFSDGEGNTSAYVSIKRDGTVLAIDLRDNLNKVEQYRNLIHEFAHIYSLPIDHFKADCDTTDLTCLKADTLIADFQDEFWHQYDSTWYENSDKTRAQLDGFYNNNITDFYVPYQATNVKEDFAITFTKFITDEMPSNSSQLKAIKVQSMYENIELVTMRVEILKAILDLEKERAL